MTYPDHYYEYWQEQNKDAAPDGRSFRTITRKARKAHKCHSCKGVIAPGSTYDRIAYVVDGVVHADKYHVLGGCDSYDFGEAELPF